MQVLMEKDLQRLCCSGILNRNCIGTRGLPRTGSRTSQYKKLRIQLQKSAPSGAVSHVLRKGHGFFLVIFENEERKEYEEKSNH